MLRTPGILLVGALNLWPLSQCSYGKVSDGEQEQTALADFILGSSRGELNLNLRFTDGGTDSISNFTTGAGAIALGSLRIEIDRIELIYEPGFFQGILTGLLYLHRAGDLYAHGEENVSTGDPVFSTSGASFTLTGANGTDPGGRNYQNLPLSLQVPPGRIKSIKLHIQSVVASGTDDGSPFASIVNQQVDSTATIQCLRTLSSGGTQSKYLKIDYSLLFATGSSSSAIQTGLQNAGLVAEAECFSF